MARDLSLLGEKLRRYREQFDLSHDDLAQRTGIPVESLQSYESAQTTPTGDEILILASFYKCDYKFFLTNEPLAPFEQTELLYRRHGDEFSPEDRWSVQEFLFLCEGEHFLREELGRPLSPPFHFVKSGSYYKGHGERAAAALRKHLKYPENTVPRNVYEDFREVGIYLFRRKLLNSNISGLFIRHPIVGMCVLVNYSEDVYRQRFTAAHEAAHAILDTEKDLVVSFSWDRQSLIETRANTFASRYLLPPEILRVLPDPGSWTDSDSIRWAHDLRVSTEALSFALQDAEIVDIEIGQRIRRVRVPNDQKLDPELPQDLSKASRARKLHLLSQGLSDPYVSLCFDAYAANLISADRLREQLLLDSDVALVELAKLYGRSLRYGD